MSELHVKHKDHRTRRGQSRCGVAVRGGQITYNWLLVTCPDCLKLQPAISLPPINSPKETA